jgi:hypothetical protein
VCRRRASRPAPPVHRPISDAGFFSDALFQPWAFGAMDLDPCWLRRETIPRAPPGLSLADFVAKYEEPNQPVILQGQVASWNAATAWTDDYLCSAAVRRLGGLSFWMGLGWYSLIGLSLYTPVSHSCSPRVCSSLLGRRS